MTTPTDSGAADARPNVTQIARTQAGEPVDPYSPDAYLIEIFEHDRHTTVFGPAHPLSAMPDDTSEEDFDDDLAVVDEDTDHPSPPAHQLGRGGGFAVLAEKWAHGVLSDEDWAFSYTKAIFARDEDGIRLPNGEVVRCGEWVIRVDGEWRRSTDGR